MMSAVTSMFSSPEPTAAATASFPQKDAYERAIAVTPAVAAAAAAADMSANKRPRSGDVNNMPKSDQNAWLKKQLEAASQKATADAEKIAELNEAVQLEIVRLRGEVAET
ncbi:hypothetical protein B484DRAFT_433441, partial [Ochromonadaceae sp. CCMP2298]